MISKATQKRVARVRKQIEAGIAKAKELGLGIDHGIWCSEKAVCPMAAVIVKEKLGNALPGDDVNRQVRAITDNTNTAAAIAAGLLHITEPEVEFFYQGFDRNSHEYASTKEHFKQIEDYKPTPRREAMYRLGRRLRTKYAAA